jgi:hypothetical protein
LFWRVGGREPAFLFMATEGGAGHIMTERINNSDKWDSVFMFYLWY